MALKKGFETHVFFTSQVRPLLERKDVDTLQDSRMSGIVPQEDFLDFIRVALLCLKEDRNDRPEMQEVVHRLTLINSKALSTQTSSEGVREREEALGAPYFMDHSRMGDTSSGSYRGLEPTIGYRGGR